MKTDDKQLNYIKAFLEEMYEKFPQTSFRCILASFGNATPTYIIEEKPLAFVSQNEKFAELESNFSVEFEAACQGYEIMFISDDSVLQPIIDKLGKTVFEIGKEKNLPQTKRKQKKLPAYDYRYSTI
jgi:hypothetical protein